MASVKLLENASATSAEVFWIGGKGLLLFEGTVGGATIKLQTKGPAGGWLDLATIAAAGVTAFSAPEGGLRVSVAAGTPSGLYAVACSESYRAG